MPRTFSDDYPAHFYTGTVVSWMDVFTRPMYCEIFLNSCNYCVEHFGLKIYAYALMTNHFHMLASSEERQMSKIVHSLKRFTAQSIIRAIEENPQESRKNWLLSGFRNCVKESERNLKHQFWKHENHPVALWSPERIGKAIDYIHFNPVKAGYVWQPQDWKYSSAIDYAGKKGLVEVELLESVWLNGG